MLNITPRKLLAALLSTALCLCLHIGNDLFVILRAPPQAVFGFFFLGRLAIGGLWVWIYRKITGERRVNVLLNIAVQALLLAFSEKSIKPVLAYTRSNGYI